MPIHCPVTIACLDADAFEKLDYRVMGHAYASQNELGRFCDECAYQVDLKARLLAEGFRSVLTEIPVTVTHRDFSKQYFLDLIADDALYELKTAAELSTEHEAQLFNYLFLLGIQRGKLLNFRPGKVQGRIVATSLTLEERRRFTVAAERWKDLTSACATLRQSLCDLLRDWGAFLEVSLYQEALIHFLGGTSNVEHRVSLSRGGIDLGTQRMLVHAPGVAFRLTAVTEDQQYVESHLRRLLALTSLKAIQWINLNHTQIELRTINSEAEIEAGE
jgi:GxxExxY protein